MALHTMITTLSEGNETVGVVQMAVSHLLLFPFKALTIYPCFVFKRLKQVKMVRAPSLKVPFLETE